MASATKNSAEIGSSRPLLLRFDDGDEESRPVILDPFDEGFRQERLMMETLQGKRCLACFEGEWLLMFDEASNECFMMSLASLSKISLPPLATAWVEKLGMLALSSPNPPNCTIMFTTTCTATDNDDQDTDRHDDEDTDEDESEEDTDHDDQDTDEDESEEDTDEDESEEDTEENETEEETDEDDQDTDEDDSEEDTDEDEEKPCLVYCRPGDQEWYDLVDETDGEYHELNYAIVGCRGTIYAGTDMQTFTAVDASSPSSNQATIQRRGIPHPDRMRWGCNKECMVESDGNVFLLQFYTHGFHNSEVIDMDIHCLDTSAYIWNKVESIGDRTIFVGDNCVACSSASRAGIQPGRVHLIYKHSRDGIRLYTIRVDDRTMTCSLLPGSSDSIYYWVVRSSSKKELSTENLSELPRKTSNKTKPTFDEDSEQVVAPWANLPGDIVENLVSMISFTDYLNVRGVCKGWSCISKPTEYVERYPTYPLLMSICSSSAGAFKLFDPVVEKEYTVKNSSLVPSDDHFQMLLFAKHGWVLVMGGEKHMYAANPFTGDRLHLPEIPRFGNEFDGVSFSHTPKSPDCTVCCIHKNRIRGLANLLYVMVWRVGDEHWTQNAIEDQTQFRTAYANPVFYHGEFYCLGTRGNLGVFNPYNMTWRVLDKPEPILDGDPMPGEQNCHLLEFRDDLFAMFRPHDEGPINLYRLDKSRMVWTVVQKLDDEVIFVDNWNALMMAAPREACGNSRIYMPKPGGYNEAGEPNKGAFYDLKSHQHHPGYYGLTERMNSIWVEPNLFNWEILISNRYFSN